jgi:8-oxo-dGTP diphosphatase
MRLRAPRAAVAVDLVVLTIRAEELCALLIRRLLPPYEGRWALPGGFVLEREGLAAAAERELEEETGLGAGTVHLEQLATYGDPERDPRGRVVSVAYLALMPGLPEPTAGGDAASASWLAVEAFEREGTALAFDHHQILTDGVERARAKLEYTTLGSAFCEDEFTVAELRRVYQSVWGVALDARNFHRKVTGTDGFVVPTGRYTNRDGGRPAQLFRAGDARVLVPPVMRPSGRDFTRREQRGPAE